MSAAVICSSMPVAKKPERPQEESGKMSKQKGIRFPNDTMAELEYVATQLGIDVSALVRLIISENLHPYREKADAIHKNRKKLPPIEE